MVYSQMCKRRQKDSLWQALTALNIDVHDFIHSVQISECRYSQNVIEVNIDTFVQLLTTFSAFDRQGREVRTVLKTVKERGIVHEVILTSEGGVRRF